jgi:hypothetical protein
VGRSAEAPPHDAKVVAPRRGDGLWREHARWGRPVVRIGSGRTAADGSHVGDLLPGLVLLDVGGSIAPTLILLTVLFLWSRRPFPNAVSLALGYLVTCAAVGVSALILFGNAGSAATVGRIVSAVVGGTLMVLGRRSLFDAPDSDTPPPSWMESTRSVSPPRAFGLGVALYPIQIKNLAIFVAPRACSAPCAGGWRGTTARSRWCSASCSGRASF